MNEGWSAPMLTGSKVDDAPATGIYAFIYNEVLDGWETCNLTHRLEVVSGQRDQFVMEYLLRIVGG